MTGLEAFLSILTIIFIIFVGVDLWNGGPGEYD